MNVNPSRRDGELPQRVREFVCERLLTGEEIIWLGQPSRLRYMKTSWLEAIMGLLSLVVTIPLALWLGHLSDSTSESEVLAPMILVLFLAGSSWLCLAPLREWYMAGATFYMITNKRAQIATTRFVQRQKLECYWPDSLNHIKRVNASPRCADVLFRQATVANDEGVRVVGETGFLGINDPDEVEDKLRSLAASRAGV
jgi:hypothetical protein